MSDSIELSAEPRTDVGKGASRRLRRLHNRVPGIMYGGDAAPVNLSLARNDLDNAMGDESFFAQVLNIKLGGVTTQAVVRDIQRHPAKPVVLHIDFLRVRADQAIEVTVPIHFANEDECVGVRLEGGVIAHALTEVEVSCLPGNLPEFIELDMTDLHVGTTLHLSDLPLPDGVSLVAFMHGDAEEHDTAVVSVQTPRGSAQDEAEDEAAAAAGDASADVGDGGDDD